MNTYTHTRNEHTYIHTTRKHMHTTHEHIHTKQKTRRQMIQAFLFLNLYISSLNKCSIDILFFLCICLKFTFLPQMQNKTFYLLDFLKIF